MVTMTAQQIPDSGIVHEEPLTEFFVKGNSCGTGTLYIAESKVLWLNSGGNGVSLAYPSIGIHAIARDTSSFPHECLFLLLDDALDEEEPMEEEESDDDSQTTPTEVRFVPSNKESLDAIYTAMGVCQELHPDPEDVDSDNEFYGDEEIIGDGTHLSAQGMSNLLRMEQMLSANGDTNGQQSEEDEMDEGGQFENA
ncbi:methylosome subunit pICln-like [Watersipora subatra]|uniref:methylosome subunit pICln-like n=1 Tax=Watersipora subatra TaxID=2589382 RepID=UPI00355B5B8A